MVYLVVVCCALGLLYGRLPALVARRVFDSGDRPLLAAGDFVPGSDATRAGTGGDVALRLATAALLGATAAVVGARWVLPAYVWMVAVTVTLTLTDLDRKLIPNRILFPSTGVAAVLLVLGALADGDAGSLGRAGIGAAAYFVALLLVALLARGGFGMGDVKLAFLLGGFLSFESWETLVVGGVGAFLLGGAVSLILLLLRVKGRKDAIPFGPYLVAAAYIALAAGAEIADWYRG